MPRVMFKSLRWFKRFKMLRWFKRFKMLRWFKSFRFRRAIARFVASIARVSYSRSELQLIKVSFYRYATIYVLVVLILVYPVVHYVHRRLCGMLQGVAILQFAHYDA